MKISAQEIKKNYYIWKYALNFKHRIANLGAKVTYPSVVADLNKNGIAFSDFDTLIKDIDFNELQSAARELLADYNLNGQIEKKDEKDFMHFLLGINPVFDAQSLYARLALHPSLQAIADQYFEMRNTSMRYYNVWNNRPVPGSAAHGSQLWHRDREDLQILKVFIYLSDVGPMQGPFYYATGTHAKGRVRQEPEYVLEGKVKRTTDDMMRKLVPDNQWISAEGKAGAIVFADTHGYHKGGFVQQDGRLLFTCMYVSPYCKRKYFA